MAIDEDEIRRHKESVAQRRAALERDKEKFVQREQAEIAARALKDQGSQKQRAKPMSAEATQAYGAFFDAKLKPLIEQVQRQQAQIEQLQSQVQTLKQRVGP